MPEDTEVFEQKNGMIWFMLKKKKSVILLVGEETKMITVEAGT